MAKAVPSSQRDKLMTAIRIVAAVSEQCWKLSGVDVVMHPTIEEVTDFVRYHSA